MDEERGSGGGANCCSCCFSIIFIIGLIFLFLWIGYRGDNPKCSIDYFYIPALNKSLNSQDNTTLNFMVRFSNPNIDNGIYYDDVHISFFNSTNASVCNYTVPKFYQGHYKKTKKWGQVLPLNNQTVLQAVFLNGPAVFRVDLKTKIRFKVEFWKTKRVVIDIGANVEVNGDGVKAQKKGIRLKKSDSSSRLRRGYFHICVFMNLIIFFVIHYNLI